MEQYFVTFLVVTTIVGQCQGSLAIDSIQSCHGIPLESSSSSSLEWSGTSCLRTKAPDPEFRALFVATVDNIDWPLASNLSSELQQQQLIQILDTAQEMNFNAIVFQVRPAFDAFYPSLYEPWSKWLSGTQGQPPQPEYDPLQFVLLQAHARGIEVHAWLNPYRGGLQTTFDDLAENHVCVTMREYCYVHDRFLWLDPGVKVIEDQLINVVRDLASRYAIDGIHFDDYFYPYPDPNGIPFPDNATYEAYLIQGGSLSLGDWRRDNVNRMVQRVYQTLHEECVHCILSISPPGSYRPGHPEGMPSPPLINNFDPYEGMYADTKLWLQSGWVDFFAPQLYNKIDPPDASYTFRLDWWLDQNLLNRNIYASNAAYKVYTQDWTVQEVLDQIQVSRNDSRRIKGSLGNIQFSAKYFRDNYNGIKDAFKEICPTPALVPPYPWLDNKCSEVKTRPRLEQGVLHLAASNDDHCLKAWIVYTVTSSGALIMTDQVHLSMLPTEIKLNADSMTLVRPLFKNNVQGRGHLLQ